MFNLIPTLSAAENIAAPLLINGVKRRDALGGAWEVLSQVIVTIVPARSPVNYPEDNSNAS